MPATRLLGYGEPLALLQLRSNRNPSFALGSMGGRFILLAVVLDIAHPDTQAAVTALTAASFNETVRVAALYAADAAGEADPSVKALAQDKLVFFDPARERLAELGFVDLRTEKTGAWVLFDPSLRLVARWPLAQYERALAALNNSPEPSAHAGVPLHAPVLLAPRIFEPDFCERLIAYYRQRGGAESGTTRENQAGKTYVALDPGFKKRFDCTIEDETLRQAAMHRVYWRLGPEIEKAFMWRPTRMERYIVACYDAESGGFFRPHRDNTTKGTAHRRFAVTINLNAEDYDGGDLRFPEFGARTYRAPTGGAVVFSCGLLHEATPVTRGQRFAFLPFLYDETAAKIRAANNPHLDETVGQYQG